MCDCGDARTPSNTLTGGIRLFWGIALPADGARDACQLCHGRRDPDNDELAAGA